MKNYFLLFIAFFVVIPRLLADTQDTVLQGEDLWLMVQQDTFPYSMSHEAVEKVADMALLQLYLSQKTDKVDGKNVAEQAFYYNLLANRFSICDSIVNSLDMNGTAYKNLLGHIALKEYLPCFAKKSEACDSIKGIVDRIFQEATEKSQLMPSGIWNWLHLLIEGKTAFKKSEITWIEVQDSLAQISLPSWEGGVLYFKLYPNTQNIVVSNGVGQALKMYQLDSNDKWEDITYSTGLGIMPGGFSMYNVDYNSDGRDDLYILRKSSSFKSPAKYYSSLLRNNGDGTFTDVTQSVGLGKIDRPNCACWGDINGDQKIDVFVGNEFSSSVWMIQDDDGNFVNFAPGYNIVSNKKNVKDCIIKDFNHDGKNDIYLSVAGDTNNLYIQDSVLQYIIFRDSSYQYDLGGPFYSNQIIPIDYDLDGNDEVIIQTNYRDDYEVTSEVLNNADTIHVEPAFFIIDGQDTAYKTIANPIISLIRAGVLIEQPEELYLIGGGGINTESLYPMFNYKLSEEGHQISTDLPINWPAYIHSMTAYADSNDQPVIIVKGGGNYPFMVNRMESYRLQMPEAGSFVRLFDYSKVKNASQVQFDIVDKKGNASSYSKKVKTLDSRGFNALQEWIWIPTGYSIKNISVEEKDNLPSSVESNTSLETQEKTISNSSKKANRQQKKKKTKK